MLYVVFVLCWIATAYLAYNEYIPEKTMYSALGTKYLSVSGRYDSNSLNSAKTNDKQKAEKMNNQTTENSKTPQIPQATQEQTSKITNTFEIDSITVYDANKKESVEMPLEEYVFGCVLAEMPSSFEAQALMAQAVAVRTFTIRKTLSDENSSHPDSFVCTNASHCQSFIYPDEYEKKSENAKDNADKVRQAVNATKGIIAVYEGSPINAVYHASSGYNTLSSNQVWGGEVSYLTGVQAPEDATLCSKEYTFTYEELSEKLTNYTGQSVECFAGNQSSIFVSVNENNCVEQLTVSQNTYNKNQLKNILSLRSCDFSMSQDENTVTFITYGYGHRVGMSQHGANALAQKGYSYKDILKYYYTGIDFSFV